MRILHRCTATYACGAAIDNLENNLQNSTRRGQKHLYIIAMRDIEKDA
jgi:hypothetical protein